jgi:RNA polymerase-binding transcription factor DksA
MNYPSDLLTPVRQFLEAKKNELTLRKQRLTQEDPFNDPESRLNNNAAIDADAAEQFGHETASAMREEIERKLAEIERAMERVEKGGYGTCTGCGLMIDTDRLTVDPIAEFCVECQRKKTVVE